LPRPEKPAAPPQLENLSALRRLLPLKLLRQKRVTLQLKKLPVKAQ
jgi:hypothetical protein